MAEGELTSTMHYVQHTQLAVDRPLGVVWPVFRDMRTWYTEYSFESVSGPPYRSDTGLAENQVLKLRFADGVPRGMPQGMSQTAVVHGAEDQRPFIMETLRVTPSHQIVAVLHGQAEGWKRYTVFYVWRLSEEANGAATTIFVDSYGEVELEHPMPKEEFDRYHEYFLGNWQSSWAAALVKFRKVLDAHS